MGPGDTTFTLKAGQVREVVRAEAGLAQARAAAGWGARERDHRALAREALD